jgi:hypothetical protein
MNLETRRSIAIAMAQCLRAAALVEAGRMATIGRKCVHIVLGCDVIMSSRPDPILQSVIWDRLQGRRPEPRLSSKWAP